MTTGEGDRALGIRPAWTDGVGPHEARVTGPVPLRALWWGDPDELADPARAAPTMVLLHGIGDGADVWRPVVAAWPGGLPGPALALDLPGHGGSARLPANEYRTDRLVSVVGTALQRLALKAPILVGHSLGARIALGLATSPCRPRFTALVDLGVSASSEVTRAVAEHIDIMRAGAPTAAELQALMAARLPLADPDALAVVVPRLAAAAAESTPTPGPVGGAAPRAHHALPLDPAITQLLEDWDATHTWAQLAAADVPIALVRGAFSSVVSAEDQRRMAAVLRRGVGAETINGAGHAIPLEKPQALAQALWRWITPLQTKP
ncbi:MAG: alpha/beta hydrolase [Pseudomonadota bacterium]